MTKILRSVVCSVAVALLGAVALNTFVSDKTFAAWDRDNDSGGWSIGNDSSSSNPHSGGGSADCSWNRTGAGAKSYFYREDCSGASWIYYHISDTSENAQPLELGMPYEVYANNQNEKVPDIPSECAGEFGGFWHYGVNGLGDYMQSYADKGNYYYIIPADTNYWRTRNYNVSKYSIDDKSWGHWITLGFGAVNWVFDRAFFNNNKPSNPSNYGLDANGGLTFSSGREQVLMNGNTKYYSTNSVRYPEGSYDSIGVPGPIDTNFTYYNERTHTERNLIIDAYNASCRSSLGLTLAEAEASHKCNATSLPKGLAAFCYWDINRISGITLQSSVRVSSPSAYVDTGFVSNKEVETEHIVVKVGDTIDLEFKHNIRATSDNNSPIYSVKKGTGGGWGSGFNYETTLSGPDEDEVYGATTLWTPKVEDGTTYWYPSTGDFIVRHYTVRIDRAIDSGSYKFCETLSSDHDDFHRATTACAVFEVEPESTSGGVYKARSIVDANGKKADTGVVGSYTKKTTSEVSVGVNDTINLSFMHSPYYSVNNTRVRWKITGGPTAGAGYEIQSRILNGSSNVDYYSGTATDRVRVNTLSNQLYTSENPIIDMFVIKFNAVGNYTFCEDYQIKTDAGYEKFTTVCTKVRVTNGSTGGAKVAAKSSISGRGDTGYVTDAVLEANRGNPVEISADLGTYQQGDTVSFSFTHWGGISPSGTSYWELTPSFESDPGGWQNTSGGVMTQTRVPKWWVVYNGVQGVSPFNSYWTTVDGVRYYSNVSSGVLSDPSAKLDYAFKVETPGNYKFCHVLSVNDSTRTKSCVSWVVERPINSCSEGDPNITRVSSYVRNDTISTQGASVYAKPTDIVTWHECYYAGVQNKVNEIVSRYDGAPGHPEWPSTDPSSNGNTEIKNVINFQNKYTSVFPDGGTKSGSYAVGNVVSVEPTYSMSVKQSMVGGSGVSDTIQSGTPIGVSITNYGIHRWECRPSSSNTGGTPVRSSYICRSGDGSPDSSLYCHTAWMYSASSTITYSCSGNTYYTQVEGDHCVRPDGRGTTRPPTSTTISYYCGSVAGRYGGTVGSSSGPYSINGGHYCQAYETYNAVPTQWYQNPKCSHSEDYITYGLTSGPASASSKVLIPYNYRLTGGVSSSNTEIFAGETMNVSGWVNLETKYNAVTRGTYATSARNVKAKLIAFVANRDLSGSGQRTTSSSNICSVANSVGGKDGYAQCATLEEKNISSISVSDDKTGTGVSNVSMNGSGSYKAFDASAGDYICFAVGVFPATSGSDTNMGDTNGDGQWSISNYACRIVAKKPTFQIYGGGLYSAGNVMSTEASKKYNLWPFSPDNYPAYNKNGSVSKVYSSWVEQSLVLKGLTNTVASGTSAAGGNEASSSFCRYRTPLSFANYSTVGGLCARNGLEGYVGNMSGTAGGDYGATLSRASYINYWLPAGTSINVASGSSVYLNNTSYYSNLTSASGVSVRYTYTSGGLTLNAGTVDKDVTHIVKATGDIRITGNLYYNGGGLSSLHQVPKLIIYGKNIKIDCTVTEIDAILIADREVDTCSNGGGSYDNAIRSNQLYIRGMVISDSMKLGRTYGAATGNYSDIPAEAINYDTSAILWGRHMAGAGESGTLTMTYTHELAPRY